jgi:hypothetical protein
MVSFRGHSGHSYRFHVLRIGAKLKSVAGVYVFTERTFPDRTYAGTASHRSLAIGETQNLAATLASKSDLEKLVARGANCMCVLAVADKARRLEIQEDIIDGHSQCCGLLQSLVHLSVSDDPAVVN